MYVRTFFVFVLNILFLSAAMAQTVEKVLNALQERVQMMATRQVIIDELDREKQGLVNERAPDYSGIKGPQSKMIAWPGFSAKYLASESVTSLEQALELLNYASAIYDKIKWEFLAYDVAKVKPVNQELAVSTAPGTTPVDVLRRPGYATIQYSGLVLPTVGVFNEANWRAKLQILASNIEQLRVLPWPAITLAIQHEFKSDGGREGDLREYIQVFTSESPDVAWDWLDEEFVFPWILPINVSSDPDTDQSDYVESVYEGPTWSAYTGVSAFHPQRRVYVGEPVFLWNGGAGYRTDWITGEHASNPPDFTYGKYNHRINGTVALKTKVKPQFAADNGGENHPDSLRNIGGRVSVFRAGRTSAWGDVTSIAVKQSLTASVYPLSAHLPTLLSSSTETLTCGSLDYWSRKTRSNSSSRWLDANTILGWMMAAWRLPVFKDVEGQWKAPVHNAGLPGSPELTSWSGNCHVYHLTKDGSAIPLYRTGFNKEVGLEFNGEPPIEHPYLVPQHLYQADAIVVASLNFSPVMPPEAKQTSNVPYGLAEVEVSIAPDPVRIHVGRGRGDLNQVGALAVRPDGFGTLLFHGSPAEFDLLYEDDPALYTDAPYGLPADVRSFDSPIELSDDEKLETGWTSWFQYIAAWHAPRLRQVRGGDLLVDIQYTSSYRKILRFYWSASLPASPTGKFYTDLGPSFKTIIVSNPTGPNSGPGLPTTKYHIRVSEGRVSGEGVEEIQRSRDVIVTPSYNGDGALTHELLTLTEGAAPGSSTVQRTASVQYGEETIITTVSNFPGGPATTTEAYYPRFSPRHVENPVCKRRSTTAGGETRTSVFTWNEPLDVLYARHWLEKARHSGASTWTRSGESEEYSREGQLSETIAIIGDRKLRTEVSLDGNIFSATSFLGSTEEEDQGSAFRTEAKTYSGTDWSEVNVKVDNVLAATHRYQIASVENAQPWSYAGTDYPGGYREVVTMAGGFDQSSMVRETGWGPQLKNGQLESVVSGRFGELINRVVTNGSVIFEAGVVVGATTAWGAPKEIAGLRGEITHLAYEETGIHLGKLKSITDPYGAQTQIGIRDWLGRPSSWTSPHAETLTPTYQTFLTTKVVSSLGGSAPTEAVEVTSSVSPFGDPRATSSSWLGMTSTRNEDPSNGTVNLSFQNGTSESRSKTVEVAPDGSVKKILAGMGSRGQGLVLGVANNRLYSEETPLTKTNVERTGKIRTYYDGHGRIVQVDRPSHSAAGGSVTESWVHSDSNRTMTYNPVLGPVPAVQRTVISEDGSTVTLSVDGQEVIKTKRTFSDGQIVNTTSIYDDTTALLPHWVEMSRQEHAPAEGASLFTPWGLAKETKKLVSSLPSASATVILSEVDPVTGADSRILSDFTLTKGLPTLVAGSSDGVTTNLNIAYTQGHFEEISGTVGGEVVGLTLDSQRRPGTITVPGGSKVLTYGGGSGSSVTVTDATRGTVNVSNHDAVGDLVSKTGSRDVDWGFNVADGLAGSTITLNGNLVAKTNPYGEYLEKNYAGGKLKETFDLWPNGALRQHTITGTGGGGGSLTTSVTERATNRLIQYSTGLEIEEELSRLGLPKSVRQGGGQNELRRLEYERLALRKEIHEDGPWRGWTVEFVPDDRGRVQTVRAVKDSDSRQFTLGYDGASRLNASSATFGPVATLAEAVRNNYGQLHTLARAGLTTTWTRPSSFQLTSVSNTKDGAQFNYSYPFYDSRHRIKSRVANRGTSWTSMDYDDADQLKFALVSQTSNRSYGYDLRQNRVNQGGTIASIGVDYTDQVTSRANHGRGFGVQGAVKLGSTLQVFNPYIPGGSASLPVNSTTGAFWAFWGLASTAPQDAILIDALIRGTYTQVGQPTAIAEQRVYLRVPPATEMVRFDVAGRQTKDAFWEYEWDGAGRLTRMESTLPINPGGGGEELLFVYDAQGRRTVKEHILTTGETRIVKKSTVLWAGWLPLCEFREGTKEQPTRRWFQWGPDVSGSLEGGGGIGGLVAIHEENAGGTWKRTLLPVTDGIGNITAVLDAADGRVVAEYQFGPFGEHLGESGEADVCPFRWQTKWFDAECQHYYFGYRHYDPRTGRWLSRDPLGEAGGFNLYAYCGNDPVNRHDPLGLESVHETKWRALASDPSAGALTQIGAALMAGFEGMNPFRSDSSLRDGGREFQRNAEKAREDLKKAPPIIREWAQFTMGVGMAGTAPITTPAGLGELGDAVQKDGFAQTGKNIAIGVVNHVKNNPLEFSGELLVGWASGKAMASPSPSTRVISAHNAGNGVPATGILSGQPGAFGFGNPVGWELPYVLAPEGGSFGPLFSSPNSGMRNNANRRPFFRHPMTNELTPATSRMPADHIVPQDRVKKMPGFDKLTPAQQDWILNHPVNTQGLPQTFNSSKGAKAPGEWLFYKNQPLHPDYVRSLSGHGDFIEAVIRAQIRAFLGGG